VLVVWYHARMANTSTFLVSIPISVKRAGAVVRGSVTSHITFRFDCETEAQAIQALGNTLTAAMLIGTEAMAHRPAAPVTNIPSVSAPVSKKNPDGCTCGRGWFAAPETHAIACPASLESIQAKGAG